MKINVAVLFGGKSVEHEVSVISAVQAMASMNTEKYTIIPVYLTKKNEFFTGELLKDINAFKDIPALLKQCRQVVFVNRNDRVQLVKLETKLMENKVAAEIDVAFPIVHGTNVEDGALQGYLQTLNLPYVGCDVLSSALGMDKYASKILLRDGGFPVLDCCRLHVTETADMAACLDKVEQAVPRYPMIVKPVNLGSSVGISKVRDRDALEQALEHAFLFSERVIVETAVRNLKEINCSVLGDAEEAEASVCEEPVQSDDILSYTDKYGSGSKSGSKSGGSKGMASLKRKIPADISKETEAKIQEIAVAAFRHLGCCGVSRIDFLMDTATNEIWINEFNTIPGSLAFYLWEPKGVSYTTLLDRMLALALKRQRKNAEIHYSFDTNILSMGGSFGSKGAKR